jgi:hypothetical protein
MKVSEYGSNAVSFTFFNSIGQTSVKESTESSSKLVSAEMVEAAASKVETEDSGDSKEGSGDSKGGRNSSITDIYLAGTEGLLVLPGKITDQSVGVSFSTGADPRNLPGGKPFDFVASVGADSNAPVQPNGVDTAKEYVTWTFALAKGVTYKDVIGAIDGGTLRIGLLVPGSSGGSASFINSCGVGAGCGGQTSSVPLPASIWLMFGALGGLTYASRRGKRERKA